MGTNPTVWSGQYHGDKHKSRITWNPWMPQTFVWRFSLFHSQRASIWCQLVIHGTLAGGCFKTWICQSQTLITIPHSTSITTIIIIIRKISWSSWNHYCLQSPPMASDRICKGLLLLMLMWFLIMHIRALTSWLWVASWASSISSKSNFYWPAKCHSKNRHF